MINGYKKYFKGVMGKSSQGTEFTLRTDIENLLNAVKPSKNIIVIQEPAKDKDIKGRPDFKVEKSGLTIGYIETKKIDTNLDDILDNNLKRDYEQLQNYLKIIPNLILTNYKEFILFRKGKPVDRGVLFYSSIDKSLNENNILKISKIFETFFSVSPKRITNPEKLSHMLAERTSLFRDFLEEFIENETTNDFKMRLVGKGGLHDVIKETLIEDLSLSDFIDAYVQTITYGLFLAEISSKDSITENNAGNFIPETLGIVRDLFKTIDIEDIPDSIDWIIEEIIDILNRIDRDKLKNKLSFSKLYDYEDPYVYFYENFLGDYDNKKRKSKGVYYTPIPVVRFIVESIDYLIRKNFDSNGLKGSKVNVLDFATGTGTFLLETFKKALEGTDEGMKQSLISERLLKRFYGFEYLIAPYTIAHLKLSQFFKESGNPLKDDERLKIYLTDTLDNAQHEGISYFQKMSKEGEEANKIKLKDDILIVMGNPPYSNYSTGEKKQGRQWIADLLDDYKRGLGEKKINIDDDYIKFLRFAQWKIDQNGHGIVGVITNNSYLDGITHRVMRKSLLDTFDEIYILNLHGNKRRGDPDQNVFDVMVGVSIVLFVKLPEKPEKKEIYYYSTLEKGLMDRELKYGFLLGNDIQSIEWRILKPTKPDYWFIRNDLELKTEYNEFKSLNEIFREYGSGIKTDRDDLFIDFDKNKLIDKIKILLSGMYSKEFIDRYKVKNSSSYKLLEKIKKENFNENNLRLIDYRPFDRRNIYYKRGLTSRPAYNVMKHFIRGSNLGLVSVRQIAENKIFNHVIITENIVDVRMTLSNRGTCYLYPLKLYLQDEDKKDIQSSLTEETFENPYKNLDPQPNFTPEFIKFISNEYSNIPTPEEILGYIYAVLYSKTYREKYNAFLKTDFPRIPFTDNWDDFYKLSKLGTELIEVHLLNHDYTDSDIASYPVDGEDIVDKIKYDKKTSCVHINKDQYFENVPEEVWNMEIGGYKVLEKWLKYRHGRKLSFDDIHHFQMIVRSLKESLSLMDKVDQSFKSAFN